MQSALAIIPFTPAMVETPQPIAESIDQAFTSAFDEGLIAPEGEIASSESMAAGLFLPPFWLGPVLSIPAVVPSGMADGGKADRLDAESEAIPDTDPGFPDPSKIVAAVDLPDLGAKEMLAIPTAATHTGLDEGPKPGLPGKTIADLAGSPSRPAVQLDSPPNAMPDRESAGTSPTETRDSHLPTNQPNDAEANAAAGTEIDASGTAEATTVPARVDDGTPAEEAARSGVLECEGSDRIDAAIKHKIARSEPSSADLGPIGRDFERTDHDRQAEVEADASSGPESTESPRRSIVKEDVEGLSERTFGLLPREPFGNPAQPPSFWERYFAEMTAPEIVAGLRADQGAGPSPIVIPMDAAAAATVAELLVETSAKSIGPLAIDVTPERSGLRALSELPAKGHSPLVAVASPPLLERLPGLIPPILLTEWDKGLLESREQLELALLSGPVLQPGSSFSAASGLQNPTSLPVQQVAVQLAGVLVNVSDKATELALAPEELGRVSLRLEPDAANPDRLTILINVERPETLDLFRRHAGELAEAIKAAGYSGADIGFGQQGQGSSPDHKPKENALGSGQPSEDPTPISPARRDVAGSTLDLRL